MSGELHLAYDVYGERELSGRKRKITDGLRETNYLPPVGSRVVVLLRASFAALEEATVIATVK